MKPTIGLLLGDPCGIGPELIAKLLSGPDLSDRARILLIADPGHFRQGQRIAGVSCPVREIDAFDERAFDQGLPVLLRTETMAPGEVIHGREMARAGRSVMTTLDLAMDLALEGKIQGICFGPFNKHALHLGGFEYSGEIDYFAARLDYNGPYCEINVMDDLWTSRVTSHVALKDVPRAITAENILKGVKVIHSALTRAGYDSPRIGVAALNPHGGESGDFGDEEIRVIGPAVAEARKLGIEARGPFPADTIFVRAQAGEFRAVVTMYHDQGQVAMKLIGFDRGVSVQGGLPLPITTPCHGTAFDIAGQGVANAVPTQRAFQLAARMAGDEK